MVLSHRSPRRFFPLRSEDSPFHGICDLSRGRDRLAALARNGGVFGVFFLAARDLEDVSKTPAITECVLRRGHSDEVVRKVLGGSFMRVFDAVLGT